MVSTDGETLEQISLLAKEVKYDKLVEITRARVGEQHVHSLRPHAFSIYDHKFIVVFPQDNEIWVRERLRLEIAEQLVEEYRDAVQEEFTLKKLY